MYSNLNFEPQTKKEGNGHSSDEANDEDESEIQQFIKFILVGNL
jgi:hypothetical protein